MYAGTGALVPRTSTWQYLQKPTPALLIHFVSYSRHRVQYAVGPVHFRHGLMNYHSLTFVHKNVGLSRSINQG